MRGWMRPLCVLLCLVSAAGARAQVFVVENFMGSPIFGAGLNFEEAVAAANANPGPDTIVFSNNYTYDPEGLGVSYRCFNFDAPLTFSEPVELVGLDDPLDLQLNEAGQLMPVSDTCVSFTGTGTAITFAAGSAGSDVSIARLLANEQAFELCAQNLSLNASVVGAETIMGLCDTDTVEADVRLTLFSDPGSITVLDEDLPVDADLDLAIYTATRAEGDGPLMLDLDASQCGGKVRLSGSDVQAGLMVRVRGCVDLVVENFGRGAARGYEPASYVPWLSAQSWTPGMETLTPSIVIENSVIILASPLDAGPLIELEGAETIVRHTTVMSAGIASDDLIQVTNTSFVADHTIVSGNGVDAIFAAQSDIELVYSMLDSLSQTASTLTADSPSNTWLLDATLPELETHYYMPTEASLARDAGDMLLAAGVGDTPQKDYGNQDRVIDGVIDIGASERNQRPVFDADAAMAELVRQRKAGESLLTINLNNYLYDADGDAIDSVSVIPQVGVDYDDMSRVLTVPASTSGRLVAWVMPRDEHGGSGDVSFLFSAPEGKKSGDGGGVAGLFLLVLLCVRRGKPGSGLAPRI